MGSQHTLALFLVAACQASAPNQTGFGSTPDLTTASVAASTGEGSTSSSTSGTSTSEGSSTDDSAAESSPEPPRDLGMMPDFGDGAPIGCNGKIDLLFVISRESLMEGLQKELTTAFPQFIKTIETKFADFDYHIMVVTGDDQWGNDVCTEACPTPTCKIGDPCCLLMPQNGDKGQPCCPVPTYPCQDLDLVTECDRTFGAGEVFPAGVDGEPNMPCPIDGDRRYLVKGQSDLTGTFECIASVGSSSNMMYMGQALTAAVQKPINNYTGYCNYGFLRKDALLMVTVIAANPDGVEWGSEGSPAEWAKSVIDAKHGDERSVVVLDIGKFQNGDGGTCMSSDRICQMTELFPYRHHHYFKVPDYGPAFLAAASLVETACAEFVPPPG